MLKKKQIQKKNKINALLYQWYDDIDEGREEGYPEWFDHGKRGPDGVVRGDQRPFIIQKWRRPPKPERELLEWQKQELKKQTGSSLKDLFGKDNLKMLKQQGKALKETR